MGSILGPMLQKELKKRWGIQAKRWGKASSGLARPDFHDWPSKVPNLMRRHRPDYVVVSLGTNDHQALKTQKGWIKTSNDRWAKSYKQRVLIMLRRLSGRDRRRAIVWLGPTNFNSNNARKLGPKINRLIKEAINEFDGPAVFVDARRATSNKNGEPGVTYRHPKKGKQPMRTSDGIHLTTDAVRTLLAAPVYKAFADCWDSDVAARDAIRQQRKEERLAKRKAKREAAKAKREAAKAKREAEKAEKQKTASKHATGDTPATSTPSAAPAAKAPKAEAKPTASAPTEGGAPKVVAPAPDKDVEPKGPKAGDAKDKEKQAGPKKDAALPDKPSDTPKGSPGADESPEGKKPSQESAKPSGASGDATTPSTGSQAKPKPKDDPDSKKETKGASKAAKEGDKGSEKAAPKPVASPSEGKAEAKTKKATCRSKKSTSDKSAPKSKPDKGAEPAEKKAE